MSNSKSRLIQTVGKSTLREFKGMISALAQEKISRHTLEDDMLLMHPEWEPGSIATKINAGIRLRKLCTDAEWCGLDLEDKRSNK